MFQSISTSRNCRSAREFSEADSNCGAAMITAQESRNRERQRRTAEYTKYAEGIHGRAALFRLFGGSRLLGPLLPSHA
jgi:hypothetical protein